MSVCIGDLPFVAAVEASLTATTRATLRAIGLAVTNFAAIEAGLIASTSASTGLKSLRTFCLAVAARQSVSLVQ